MRTMWCPALAGLTVIAARRLCVVVYVRGNSMRPTYADGDVLLAVRSPLRTGRVVVFRPPLAHRDPTNPPYRVKRLIAVAGDATPEGVRGQLAGVPIPPGWLVVRGDNENSEDSRDYGYVAARDVIAVVIARIRSTARRTAP